MTLHYVDPLLSGTTANYSVANRDTSGSGVAGYATIAAANTVASAGDEIIIRGGSLSVSAVVIFSVAGITISIYPNEICELTMTADAHIWQVAATCYPFVANLSNGSGYLKFNSTEQAYNKGIIRSYVVAANAEPVVNGGVNNTSGASVVMEAIGVVTFNYMRLAHSEIDGIEVWVQTAAKNIATIINFNYCIHESAFREINAICTVNVRAPTLLPARYDKHIFDVGNYACVVNVYNPLMFVGYLQSALKFPFSVGAAAVVNLYGGVVVSNPQNETDGIKTGAGVLNEFGTITTDAVPKFENYGSTRMFVTFQFGDLNTANGTRLPALQAVFDASGVKGAYACDDMTLNSQSATVQADINAWIAGGHELLGYSAAADRQDIYDPFKIRYTGTGVGRFRITNNGKLWECLKDGVVVMSFDTTHTDDGANYVFAGKHGDANRPFGIINQHADWEIAYNAVTSAFDDTYAESWADCDYTLTTNVFQILSMDATRRHDLEIGYSKTVAHALYGKGSSTWNVLANPSNVAAPTAVHTLADSLGFAGVLEGSTTVSLSQSINTVSANAIKKTVNENDMVQVFMRTGYTVLTEPQKQARLESQVRKFCAAGFAVGGYYVLEFPWDYDTPGATFTAQEVGWMVEEFQRCGAEIVCPTDAIALIGAATVSTDAFDLTQSADSQCIGKGYKWWGNAGNPMSFSGESFSDLHTDPGAAQSTHGAFHPVNL